MKTGTTGFKGIRLKEAREARGISGVALAELIGVSRSAVSQYETGTQTPRPDVMERISTVLRLPVAYFRHEIARQPRSLFFRSLSAATKGARLRAERRYEWLHEIVAYLRQFIEFPPIQLPDIKIPMDPLALSDSDIESIAEQVRRSWGLGDGPIENVVWLLEQHGAIVIRDELQAETMDAFSEFVADEQVPFVVLGADKRVAVRSRFDAAHELGHLILHRAVPKTDVSRPEKHAAFEAQAYRFAGAFLLPSRTFASEFYAPSLDALMLLKPRWKVSVGMMIMRAQHLDFIPPHQAKLLWIYLSRRGWKVQEPLDDEMPVEEPRTLRRAFELLLREGIQTREQILASIPLHPNDIEALAGITGLLTTINDEPPQGVRVVPLVPKMTAASRPTPERPADVIPFPPKKRS